MSALIGTWLALAYIHRVQKKPSPLIYDNNFGKCGPIFKFFSPGDV